jgi:hypothetical protein
MNSKNRGSPTRPLLSFSHHDRIHLYKADDPLADSVSILFVVGSVLPAPISLGALRLDVSSQLRPLKIRADKHRQEALKGRLVGKTVEWMMGHGAPSKCKLLGQFLEWERPRRSIAPQSPILFRSRVRELTRRTRGKSLTQIVKELSVYLTGWRSYFGFCEIPSVLRDLDQ